MNKWFLEPAVIKALRSKSLRIAYSNFGTGIGFQPEVVRGSAYNLLLKAYERADHAGRCIEHYGFISRSRINEDLGLLVLPQMLIAAQIGAPYEWQGSPLFTRAEEALAEINAA